MGTHGLRLVDTAGLNAGAGGLEALGIAKTLERAALADIFLVVVDASRPTPPLTAGIMSRIKPSNTIFVLNKSDLLAQGAQPVASVPEGYPVAAVSAASGRGIEPMLAMVAGLAEGMQRTVGEERIAINVRHAHFLSEARIRLEAARGRIAASGPAELVASDLRGALDAFGEISGKVDNERMLDQLFASFCIGK